MLYSYFGNKFIYNFENKKYINKFSFKDYYRLHKKRKFRKPIKKLKKIYKNINYLTKPMDKRIIKLIIIDQQDTKLKETLRKKKPHDCKIHKYYPEYYKTAKRYFIIPTIRPETTEELKIYRKFNFGKRKIKKINNIKKIYKRYKKNKKIFLLHKNAVNHNKMINLQKYIKMFGIR